jgi:hypothetical protein
MPLQKRRLPFNDVNFLFELKYDGFRALAVAERRPEFLATLTALLFEPIIHITVPGIRLPPHG